VAGRETVQEVTVQDLAAEMEMGVGVVDSAAVAVDSVAVDSVVDRVAGEAACQGAEVAAGPGQVVVLGLVVVQALAAQVGCTVAGCLAEECLAAGCREAWAGWEACRAEWEARVALCQVLLQVWVAPQAVQWVDQWAVGCLVRPQVWVGRWVGECQEAPVG
jgi:hypothetical protein